MLLMILCSGEGVKRGSQSRSRSGSRKNREYSIGLGRSQSGGMSEEAEDGVLPNSMLYLYISFYSRWSAGGASTSRSLTAVKYSREKPDHTHREKQTFINSERSGCQGNIRGGCDMRFFSRFIVYFYIRIYSNMPLLDMERWRFLHFQHWELWDIEQLYIKICWLQGKGRNIFSAGIATAGACVGTDT